MDKLNLIYNKLLFRDIDSVGMKFYMNKIQSNMTFEWIENHIKKGDEYKLKVKLNTLYNKILKRDIDKLGYLHYKKKIHDKSIDFIKLENQLYQSDEYISNKLKGIDKIFYINLDRSKKRNKIMIKLLKNINIKFERFRAIDGNCINIKNIIFKKDCLQNRFFEFCKLSNKYEIACTLSHLKLLSHILNEDGRYFLVLEDDVNFENLKYFKYDLKKIIDEAPKFDILMLYKTSEKIPDTLYKKWDFNYLGTVAYIVDKKNLIKIKEYYNFNDKTLKLNCNLKFNSADKYIYRLLNTYVYKYNIISTNCNESTIHNNHLEYHKVCIKKNNYEIKNL